MTLYWHTLKFPSFAHWVFKRYNFLFLSVGFILYISFLLLILNLTNLTSKFSSSFYYSSLPRILLPNSLSHFLHNRFPLSSENLATHVLGASTFLSITALSLPCIKPLFSMSLQVLILNRSFSRVLRKMILRDLSEVDEGNFSQVPYIGTPLERQICAHCTRADGSLNRRGYYSKVWGYPVNSSEVDSSSDDSSSSSDSSGASSDCVIISASSFTRKWREVSLAIVAVGSKVATMEVSSRFQTEASIISYRAK
jgi:hypothetical protein